MGILISDLSKLEWGVSLLSWLLLTFVPPTILEVAKSFADDFPRWVWALSAVFSFLVVMGIVALKKAYEYYQRSLPQIFLKPEKDEARNRIRLILTSSGENNEIPCIVRFMGFGDPKNPQSRNRGAVLTPEKHNFAENNRVIASPKGAYIKFASIESGGARMRIDLLDGPWFIPPRIHRVTVIASPPQGASAICTFRMVRRGDQLILLDDAADKGEV